MRMRTAGAQTFTGGRRSSLFRLRFEILNPTNPGSPLSGPPQRPSWRVRQGNVAYAHEGASTPRPPFASITSLPRWGRRCGVSYQGGQRRFS